MQSAIHEGYEYQDYFSVSIILQLIMQQIDANIVIDRKDFKGDKFDDLKVITSNGSTEYQIKYSDNESSHALTKDDFANGNGHDTALSNLFYSWKKKGSDAKIKLCLAWSRPAKDDKITEFLRPTQDQSMLFPGIAYKFDGELFWPNGKQPRNTWRKFNTEIREGLIKRTEFLSFCDELTIFLEMPKASLDLQNPGGMEYVLIRQTEKLGIGVYPNNNLTVENVINKLAAEVKHARAMGNRLNTSSLSGRLGIIMNYGKFDQRFPVDAKHQIILGDEVKKLCKTIWDNSRVILTGNPGSGKSWLVDELINELEKEGNRVVHYNCFQSLQDPINLERIRVTSLYGNLVAQIIEQYPELTEYKNTLFGADKKELENLLNLINDKFYIIIDGLDHISREYELNKDEIARSETDIISALMEIDFPDNCFVLVSSQPIDELDQFEDRSFTFFRIEPWKLDQVKLLMDKYHITDVSFDEDSSTSVSGILLNKSQGNVLYLSYILRQLQDKEIARGIIDEIPDYDIDLSEYYTYLYTKVRCTLTVFALCGADFYLSENDLMEITGIGEYVKQDISLLHPLLIENLLCGGYSIYHESFRRFVLSLLKENRVNIEKRVYGLITDWLIKKPFFGFDKAFYYLPELLYKIKNDDDNIAMIETEYVLNAVEEGYSREYIRKNLNYMIRSAGRARNLIALAMASELLAMLDDLNEFESTGEEYFTAVCNIKGATKINQLMQIDGKPTFDVKTGLLACYISSKADAIPWWDLYLDTEANEYRIEDAKYYLRFYLDNQGIGIIPTIMKNVEENNASSISDFIKIAYNELIDYIGFEEIVSIAKEHTLTHWKNYLTYIQTGYYTVGNNTIEEIRSNLEKILGLETVTEDDVDIINEFFSQIYTLAKNGNARLIDEIVSECKNINWFYNWVIYCIRIAELSAKAEDSNSFSVCESVMKTMQLLLLDTAVFKGKPRTCDLYYLQHELTMSYEKAIRLILKSGTLQDLTQALDILERLGDETGTSIDHHMGGPLPDSEFIELLSHFLTADNYDILKPYLIRTQEKIEKNEVYDCIAAAKLRFVSIVSKYDFTEACDCFKKSIRYLVAYGYHKDIIIEQILDSYCVYYKTVTENPIEERDAITKMTFALLNHTDGRETKHFLNNWFDKLLETEPKYALSFLAGLHIKQGRSWIVERMILSVIEKYCGVYQYSAIVNGLIESLPNETSPRLIDASTEVIKTLVKESKGLSGEEALWIKKRINELVVNIVSRFNILDSSWPYDESWKDRSIKEFLLTVEAEGINVSQYLEYFHIKEDTGRKTEKALEAEGALKEKKTNFDASTLQDAKEWFETHDILEQDVPDICGFLNNYREDKDTLLEIMRIIIKKSGGWNYSKKRKNTVYQIIEQFGLDNKEMAEVHMMLYLGSYEWGSSLIDQKEFLSSLESDVEVAYDIFFRELPDIIISRSGRITKGLIDALFASGYKKESIITIWRNVFNIMKLRFPNLSQYSIDFVSEETEEPLGLRNCLLTRFVDERKEQFLAAYAYMADKAEGKKYTEFAEAVCFCLDQFKHFNLVTQLAIAYLIWYYGFQLPEMCQKRLNLAIDSIYPTRNLLLDVILAEFTIYKKVINRSSNKHAPDYMEQEDVEFYLSEKLFDLGKVDQRDVTDDYAQDSWYRDSIMNVLRVCGIDYVSLYKKLHSSKILNDEISEFVGNSIGTPEMNTVYKSYAIQYALHAIIEKAYVNRVPELIRQTLFSLLPDYSGMYRMFKSREIAPLIHLYEENDSQKDIIKDADFTRLGCFEIRRYIDYRKTKYTVAYMGIVRASYDKDEVPLNRFFVTSFENRKNYQKTRDPMVLIDIDSSLDKELEDNFYLWPNENVCEILDLHTEFDFLNGRYVAVNQNQEVVFYMKNWQSCYWGDSDFQGQAIPLYVGTELYIKTDYLTVLQEHYGKLHVRIKVESHTHSY